MQLDRADDADHLQPFDLRARVGDIFRLSGRYMRRPIGSAFGQNLFASRSSTMTTLGASGGVAVGEEAAALERHAQRLEEAGCDLHLIRRDHRLARRHHVSLGDDRRCCCRPAERQIAGRAGGRDARDGADALERALDEAPAASHRPYSATGRPTWPVRTCSALKPGSTASSCRKLANSSPAPMSSTNASATCTATSAPAHDAGAPAGGSGPAVLAQDDVEIDAGELRQRHRADDDALQDGQPEREGHDHPVHADLVTARQLRQAERRQPVEAPRAEGEPERDRR